jgi:hypothetical protein
MHPVIHMYQHQKSHKRSLGNIYNYIYLFWTTLLAMTVYWNPFPADNFSKNKTKVIPNKECIILTHNLLKLYISNLNQIHLQQCFARYVVILQA